MRVVVLPALAVVALLATGCAAVVAGSGKVSVRNDNDTESSVDINLSMHDRTVIRSYYAERKRKGLPPGLAKRGGKLPPGLARRDRLPSGLEGDPLPADLERRLTPLPVGYVRLRIGADIVLMDGRTRVIMDVAYGVAF